VSEPIRLFVTGGTFDKEYDEIHGRLFFEDTHIPEMLQMGRCRLEVRVRTLMMIDSLEMLRRTIQTQSAYSEMGLNTGEYGLVTLHRPSNVDDPHILTDLCHALVRISKRIPLVFPVPPRARKNIENLDLYNQLQKEKGLVLSEPINYIRFMNLIFNCRFALTDSGGIQEETSYLGIPCLTLRPNTERPITITQGTNRLCTLEDLEKNVTEILSFKDTKQVNIDLWDGQTAGRVVESIKRILN